MPSKKAKKPSSGLKKTKEEFANEREAFHRLMDSLPDSIYFKDVKSRFTLVNKALAARLKAKGPRDMISKTDFDYFSSEHAQGAYDDEQKMIRTGKPLVGIVEKETFTDGSLRWVSTTKEPFYDKKGNIIGSFGISRDITELKRAEDALQKAKNALEVRVLARTADLRKANFTLEHRITQLRFLNSISNKLAQFIHLDDLYQAIIAAFKERLPLDTEASLCLYSSHAFVCVHATPGLLNNQGKKMSENALELLGPQKLQQQSIMPNWMKDKSVGLLFGTGMKMLPCYIVVPLIADNSLLGVVQIFTAKEYVASYKEEKEVFATLSGHAAVCLGKAIHFKELGEKARLQGELDAARSIQRKFIPASRPSIPRISLKGAYYPANEVSGDYLDYFQIPSGRWIIVIADVCGKGIPAALVMAMLRSTFRAESKRTDASSAKELMTAVNAHFISNLDVLSFVTALCLIINSDGTTMSYSRGGHPHLLRMRPDCTAPEVVACKGIAFGFLDNNDSFIAQTEEVTVPLVKGDRFFIYTDGLIDAYNPEKESYGCNRLFSTLAGQNTADPGAMIDGIMTDIRNFTRGAPNHDDLTMLAMTVTG
jgi:PAS domain S-box-containing protein